MGIDVYDYTLLKKRGILKIPEEKDIDLSKMINKDGTINITQSDSAASNDSSPFGFLDSLASSTGSTTPSASVSNISNISNSDISNLKVALDNLEFKIERLLERIEAIEMKFKI